MRIENMLKKLLLAGGALLFSSGIWAQNEMVLVSGTDFSCSGQEKETYKGLSDVDGFLGFLRPSMSSSLKLTPDAAMDAEDQSSTFVDGEYYAITNNPCKLDSFRLYDSEEAYWGMLLPKSSSQQTVLSYSVLGLKPGNNFQVQVEYCYVPGYSMKWKYGFPGVQNNNGTLNYGGLDSKIKFVVNPDANNITNGQDVGFSTTQKEQNDCVVQTLTAASTNCGAIQADGKLSLYVNATQQTAAVMIKNIKVFAQLKPEIYSVDGDVICAGEIANLKLKATYHGAKYQWYEDGVAIPGATEPNYSFETAPQPSSHKYELKVTCVKDPTSGKTEYVTFTSNTIDLETEKCCEVIIDGVSVPASRKIVFKEDFGEFDLSDKSGKTYKVWDYSDIANPKQITKTTTSPFRYALDEAPLGCTFQGASGKEIVDGEYTVAGVLTGYNPDPITGLTGAKMGWAGRIGGKTTPLDPEYDHSGDLAGCALFINCKPNTQGQNIYERKILNLCQNRQLFFECYFTVFTNSANGAYNPVDITLKMTEIGNEDNSVSVRGTATIQEAGGTGTWVKLSDQIFLEKNDAILLEVINNQNTDQNGNDLVLDDIIIKACAAPSLQAYFDINTFETDTTTCDGKDIVVYAKPSEMLSNYFGGVDKTRFLYQYSLTPDVKTSWKNCGDATEEVSKLVSGSSAFSNVKDGDVVYFRVIAGSDYTLGNTKESDFNADDPCASYTISEAIPCEIKCPTCTEPTDPEISATATNGTVTEKGKKFGNEVAKHTTIRLCKDGEVTLSSNDIAGTDLDGKTYIDYTITWHKESATSAALEMASPAVVAPELTVAWEDATEEGVMYIVKVHDIFEDGSKTKACDKLDTVIIIANPKPVVPEIVIPAFCEGLASKTEGVTDSITAIKEDLKGYSYVITKGTDEYESLDDLLTALDALKYSETAVEYTIKITDVLTGCESEPATFGVTINKIPGEPTVSNLQFVVKPSGEESVGDAASIDADYTLQWAETTETAIEPGTTVSWSETIPTVSLAKENTFYFFVRNVSKEGGCEGPAAKFKVEILSSPVPNHRDTTVCVGSEVVLEDDGSNGGLVSVDASDGGSYELQWYATETGGEPSASAPTVSTSSPSQQIFYVSQKSKAAPYAESARVPVTITTIGVKEPTVTTPVEYCKNEKAVALTAEKQVDETNEYYMADGFMWKGGEYKDYSATAPTPSTEKAGDTIYSVYQTYEIKGKLGSVIQTCKGDPANITVKVYETEAPKEATVQYIKADATGNTFPAITQATTGAWKPEENFKYYYSAVVDLKDKELTESDRPSDGYTTTVPVPTYDVSALGGGTKELYCWVYRISEANGKDCASDTVMITIKISDALPPLADNAYVCEGDAFPHLSAKANILEGSGKTADDYEIRWYEIDPTTEEDPTPVATGNTYDPEVSKAVADGGKKKEYYRYVTQYDKTTDAESSPTTVTITVWPKPVWELTDGDPEAKCEEPVDLSGAGSLTNADDCSAPVSYKYLFGETEVAATTSITGLYNVIPSYELPTADKIIYASEKTCEGEPVEVNVRVDSLTVKDIFGTTSVCPGEVGVGLTAKIDSSKTKPLSGLTYEWTGSQEGSGADILLGRGAAIVLEKFSNVKNTKYNYTVTVSTGVCKKSSEEHTIKVGEGVKEGTLTAIEVGNKDINSDETEDGGKAVFENGEKCEIYTCGGEVMLIANFTKDAGSEYKWYEIDNNNDTVRMVEEDTLKIPKSDVASAKFYSLKYVNKCDVNIDIIVHNIPITVNFTEEDETLCEDASFTKEFTLVDNENDETPVIQWYRDGKEISGANQQIYTKSGIKEDIDEGVYSFKVSNRGCVVEDTVGELDVQRYIKVEPKTDPYIVIRGDRADMTVKITVPEDQEVAYVGWAEDSRDTVNKVKDYTIAAVDKNHDYTIELKDPDYCPTTTTIQLLVDAKLQLKATLSDTLCLGTGDDLVLDTAGTGAFYDKTIQHSLTVDRMMGGSKQDITGDFKSEDGKLVHNAQPTENATYRVLYTYGKQKIDTTLSVVVIPSISLDVPEVQTVCEGEEVELAVSNVQPDGTTVSWQADPTIKSPMDDTLKITAQPTYNAATGANHQGEYTYVAIAYNEFCGKSEKFEVKVKVDEPLTGEITGTERMCEGESGRIDASKYAASQYVWTADGEEIGTSPSMSVKPAETTTYSLEMTRGKCSASDEFTVEVTSIPVILSVDSIDVRTREIVTDEGKGTRPFTYWVDKESAKTKEPIIYDLAFSKHVAYVKDDNGCQTQFEFQMDPPAIFIPEYFTPNGDGINDTWEIGNVTEVYPNAHIQIFDRFGKLLVDMTGAENSWDGTYNGNKLPSTDYWYVIDIEEIDMQYNGHFTLIRQ